MKERYVVLVNSDENFNDLCYAPYETEHFVGDYDQAVALKRHMDSLENDAEYTIHKLEDV